MTTHLDDSTPMTGYLLTEGAEHVRGVAELLGRGHDVLLLAICEPAHIERACALAEHFACHLVLLSTTLELPSFYVPEQLDLVSTQARASILNDRIVLDGLWAARSLDLERVAIGPFEDRRQAPLSSPESCRVAVAWAKSWGIDLLDLDALMSLRVSAS